MCETCTAWLTNAMCETCIEKTSDLNRLGDQRLGDQRLTEITRYNTTKTTATITRTAMRQSAMMATTKQVANKDERGVPRTTVTTIYFILPQLILFDANSKKIQVACMHVIHMGPAMPNMGPAMPTMGALKHEPGCQLWDPCLRNEESCNHGNIMLHEKALLF